MQQADQNNTLLLKYSSLSLDAKTLNGVIKLQSLVRMRQAQKKTKKLKHMLRYRKNILQELIQTQQTYIYDLSLIICDFKHPMLSQKLVDEATLNKIFCYVEEIRKLNEEFFVELFNRLQLFSDYKMVFDEGIIKLVHFFKIYFQYIQNFQPAQRIIANLISTSPKFKDFIDRKRVDPKFRGLDIDSFLIKPIQRPGKYVILLKDLVKHTPLDHPDYANILKFLREIEKVNCHNNESMNKTLNNLKITELERNLSVSLIRPGREFVCEEVVNVLGNNNHVKDTLLYLFTDLILITYKSKGVEKVYNQMVLSRGSICKDMKDMRYFKNLFTVNGNEGKMCTFTCNTEEEKHKLMQHISVILDNLNEKKAEKARIFVEHRIHNQSVINDLNEANFQVEVDVLGTEQRNTSSLSKYTVYIVQAKVKSIKHKIFIRFNQLLAIQDFVDRTFPRLLGVGFQKLYKSTWLKNHDNKVIEERKLQIQEFLQGILSMREIRENGDEVLSQLGLPLDFYFLPEKIQGMETSSLKKNLRISKRRVSARSYLEHLENTSSEDDSDDDLVFKRFKMNRNTKRVSSPNSQRTTTIKSLTAEELLYANEMSLGHYTRISQQAKRKSQEVMEVQVSIMIPSEKLELKQLVIKIEKSTRIQYLAIIVANRIGLKYYKDFRFFLKNKDNTRILDDDQIIDTVVKGKSGIFSNPSQIHFQKFIYIHPDLQQREIKQDRVRLTLLSNQALIEIKSNKFRVEYQDYLVFVSLYLMLNGYQPNTRYLKEMIQNILPQDVFNQLESRFWVQDISKCYNLLQNKLKSIHNENKRRTYLGRYSQIDSEEYMLMTTDFGCTVRMTIIHHIQKHFLYGVCLNFVQISLATRDYLIQLNNEVFPTRNLWLGIRYDKLMLVSADLSHIILSLSYQDLEDIKCEPHCILISTDKTFKLKTTKSYFISEIIEYYQKYIELYQRVDKDTDYSETVINRAREQMKSLIVQGESVGEASEEGRLVMTKKSF